MQISAPTVHEMIGPPGERTANHQGGFRKVISFTGRAASSRGDRQPHPSLIERFLTTWHRHPVGRGHTRRRAARARDHFCRPCSSRMMAASATPRRPPVAPDNACASADRVSQLASTRNIGLVTILCDIFDCTALSTVRDLPSFLGGFVAQFARSVRQPRFRTRPGPCGNSPARAVSLLYRVPYPSPQRPPNMGLDGLFV